MEEEKDYQKRKAKRAQKLKDTKKKKRVAEQKLKASTKSTQDINAFSAKGDFERETAWRVKYDSKKNEKKFKRKVEKYADEIEEIHANEIVDGFNEDVAGRKQVAVETFSSFDTKDGDQATESEESTGEPY